MKCFGIAEMPEIKGLASLDLEDMFIKNPTYFLISMISSNVFNENKKNVMIVPDIKIIIFVTVIAVFLL